MLGSFSLSLIEAAREFADRVHFLLKFNGKREKVDSLPRLFGSGCGAQKCGVTIMDERASVCLLAYSPDIYGKFSSSQVHFIGLVVVLKSG